MIKQNIVKPILALASVALLMLVFPASSIAATTQPFRATFVEVGGATETGSCGSATISQLGHVANQCVVFNGCGPNCELRTITFDDGSTLVLQESIVGYIAHGKSAGLLQISFTIDGATSTGRFAGAVGGGTGTVILAAYGVVTASGTITLQ